MVMWVVSSKSVILARASGLLQPTETWFWASDSSLVLLWLKDNLAWSSLDVQQPILAAKEAKLTPTGDGKHPSE